MIEREGEGEMLVLEGEKKRGKERKKEAEEVCCFRARRIHDDDDDDVRKGEVRFNFFCLTPEPKKKKKRTHLVRTL